MAKRAQNSSHSLFQSRVKSLAQCFLGLWPHPEGEAQLRQGDHIPEQGSVLSAQVTLAEPPQQSQDQLEKGGAG